MLDVRELAAAIYYLLLRKNFEDASKINGVAGSNCTRVKVQSTIAISEVGAREPSISTSIAQIVTNGDIKESHFRRALGTVVWFVVIAVQRV